MSASRDGTVKVWNVGTSGSETLGNHTGIVYGKYHVPHIFCDLKKKNLHMSVMKVVHGRRMTS